MQMTRRGIMLGAMGVAIGFARGAGAGPRLIGGPAFGSSWRATLAGRIDLEGARRMLQNVIAEVDQGFSPYRADSDLSRFNAGRALSWHTFEPEFVDVTGAALQIAEVTGGSFDPTVGPLVARHGFGPIQGRAGSFRDIELRGKRLRKLGPQATLDLCGIAKGYALDRAVQVLKTEGAGPAILDIGGEVKALGMHPEGRPWTVAVADPQAPGRARCIVALSGLALATSGHAANGVRGRAQTSHIIDPRRGKPAEQDLLSVSVLDRSAMRADALATALCAAGAEAGPRLARRLDVRAYFILEGADQMTGGFERHILT